MFTVSCSKAGSLSKVLILAITFFALLPCCETESFVNPKIEFVGGEQFKFPSDSAKVGSAIKFEFRFVGNENDLLTRLFIYASEDSIENMYLRPPVSAFGYKFSFTKTKAETDSIFIELYDEGGNVGKSMITIHTKN